MTTATGNQPLHQRDEPASGPSHRPDGDESQRHQDALREQADGRSSGSDEMPVNSGSQPPAPWAGSQLPKP